MQKRQLHQHRQLHGKQHPEITLTPLPDRFDLLVRKAREADCSPERQVDLLLGGLFALAEWHFVNQGSRDEPQPLCVELDATPCLPLFTNTDKADTFTTERGQRKPHEPLGLISIRPRDAVAYLMQFEAYGCSHVLVNPGPFCFLLATVELELFYKNWKEAGAELAGGYWIPNMTTEEEDFWQEHEL